MSTTTEHSQSLTATGAPWLRRLHLALRIVWVASVAAILATIALAVAALAIGDPAPLDFASFNGYEEMPLEIDPALLTADYFNGLFPPNGVAVALCEVGGWLPSLIVGSVLLGLLVRTVSAARHGDPFRADIVRRLITAGRVALIAGTAAAGIEAWMQVEMTRFEMFFWAWSESNGGPSNLGGSAIVTTFPPSIDSFVTALPWGFWVVGLALLCFAGVFRRGIAMREELDGLV